MFLEDIGRLHEAVHQKAAGKVLEIHLDKYAFGSLLMELAVENQFNATLRNVTYPIDELCIMFSEGVCVIKRVEDAKRTRSNTSRRSSRLSNWRSKIFGKDPKK